MTRRDRKQGPGLVVALVVIAALAACGGGESIADKAASATSTTRPSAPTSAQTTAAPRTAPPPTVPATTITTAPFVPDPINLRGSGKTATEPFALAGGLVTFHSVYNSGSNFIVRLATTQGQSVGGSLVNVIGAFDGHAARNVAAGQYILNVESSGSWTVTVEQPRPTTGAALPISYDGNGPDVAGPFVSKGGGIRFGLKYSGQSNFIVALLDKTGQRVGNSLANEIGATESSEVRPVSAGVYYLSVEASGPWHIDETAT